MELDLIDDEVFNVVEDVLLETVVVFVDVELVFAVLDVETFLVLDKEVRVLFWEEIFVEVEVLDVDVDVAPALQAPAMEGTALGPEPMATRFVPQLAACARRMFMLS